GREDRRGRAGPGAHAGARSRVRGRGGRLVNGMSLRIALRALGRNKVRSALTMLGVIIGVAAVIAMVAIGSGATQSVQKQIATMGQDMLMILPGSSSSGAVMFGSGSVQTLT